MRGENMTGTKNYKSYKNKNIIITNEFSHPEAKKLYDTDYAQRPSFKAGKLMGKDCCTCRFFLPLNGDYGLCNNSHAEFYHCTLFEHFRCDKFIQKV